MSARHATPNLVREARNSASIGENDKAKTMLLRHHDKAVKSRDQENNPTKRKVFELDVEVRGEARGAWRTTEAVTVI